MLDYLKLMRIKNYIKNFLIFLPFIFSKKFLDLDKNYLVMCLGFLCFCCCSSIAYILNDIFDLENDKLDSKKKDRPLASGKLRIKNAIYLIILLFLVFIIGCFYLKNLEVFIIGSFYLVLNLLYSKLLKNIPIIDITVLSSFFLIRIYYGAYLVNVPVSVYLYLTILSVAFMMGINKRKIELIQNKCCRPVLEKYNTVFLDNLSFMFCGLSIVFYSLWVINHATVFINSNILYISIFLVVFILIYYQYVMSNNNVDSNPVDVLLNNKVLLLVSILYCILILLGFVYD